MSKKDVDKKTKIMVFGTFDGLHKGHLNFFQQAREIAVNPFLIVSIARDKNVVKIKGETAFFSEEERIALVKKCRLVNKVVLSGVGDHIPHILKENPDIIALGYDQKFYVKNLKKDLKNKGIFVKIKIKKKKSEIVRPNHIIFLLFLCIYE